MKEKQFNTPVLFLIFNRPEETFRVFEKISEIKPAKLYIASDGARTNIENETIENLTKNLLAKINWQCDVKTLFRNENMGCKYAVSSAIDWFFENEVQGIILEDDCLPELSFFRFCEELLEKYKDNDEVMMITGTNELDVWNSNESYLFSKYGSVWGWAGWKTTWQKYDIQMSGWKSGKDKQTIKKNINNRIDFKYRSKIFDAVCRNKIDTWAYQLNFTLLKNNGLCIVPAKNTIKNIGFGKEATHTTDTHNNLAYLQSYPVSFPLEHTKNVTHSEEYDIAYLKKQRERRKPLAKIRNLLKILKQKSGLGTQSNNWKQIEYFDSDWKERIKIMAAYLEPGKIVTDLGCGKMWLKEYIPETNIYYPVDYINRGDDTVICDFNNNEFPTHKSEIAFVSGCLEYIEKPEVFIRKIAENNTICILSYCTTDNFKTLRTRKANAWKNNLSRSELIKLFSDQNMKLYDENITESKNNIFIFKK